MDWTISPNDPPAGGSSNSFPKALDSTKPRRSPASAELGSRGAVCKCSGEAIDLLLKRRQGPRAEQGMAALVLLNGVFLRGRDVAGVVVRISGNHHVLGLVAQHGADGVAQPASRHRGGLARHEHDCELSESCDPDREGILLLFRVKNRFWCMAGAELIADWRRRDDQLD